MSDQYHLYFPSQVVWSYPEATKEVLVWVIWSLFWLECRNGGRRICSQQNCAAQSYHPQEPSQNGDLARKPTEVSDSGFTEEVLLFCNQLFTAWFTGFRFIRNPSVLPQNVMWGRLCHSLEAEMGGQVLLAEVMGNTKASFSSLSSEFSRIWTLRIEAAQGRLISSYISDNMAQVSCCFSLKYWDF